jgi:MFS transporter, ACS family, D-galactonate transporter
MTVSRASLAPEVAVQDATPALKHLPQRWWLLLLLFAAMLIGYAHRQAINIALAFPASSMSRDLNISSAARDGVLFSAFFWIYTCLQMPAGWLVDRFGVRRTYSLGFVFWVLATALTSLANGLFTLVGVRMAIGVGQSIAFPASSRTVANWFQERERGTVTAVYLTGVRCGVALINFMGAFFLARYDWRLFFLIIGLLPLIWVLPWTLFLRKWEKPVEKAAIAAGDDPAPATRLSFIKCLFLLKYRSVFGTFLGFFAYNYTWYMFTNWMPGYLARERGFTPKEVGIYTSTPFIVMAVVILFSGIVSDRIVKRGHDERKVRKIFIVIGLVFACLIVPAGMVEDRQTSVWLLMIALCGLGIATPNTWTLTQAVSGKKIVGTVSGIQNFGGNVGGILAPLLTGIIAHRSGSFAPAFGLTGFILVAGMLAYWLLVTDKVEPDDAALT